MKKLLTIFFVLFSVIGLGQAIPNNPATQTYTNLAQLALVKGGQSGVKVTALGGTTAGDGGGGEFYWDANSVLSPVAGKIIAVTGVPTGRWILITWPGYTVPSVSVDSIPATAIKSGIIDTARIRSIVAQQSDYVIKNYGSYITATPVQNQGLPSYSGTSIQTILTTMFAASSDTLNIQVGKGVYPLTTTLDYLGRSNVKLIGDAAIFTSTINYIIQIDGSSKNLEIAGIKFVSTVNDPTEDAGGMIFLSIFGATDTLRNINIHDNYFTNPLTKCNGVKLISQGNASMCTGLKINHNKFHGIGRMAVEFQNHNFSPAISRYTNFEVCNNELDSVGSIQSGVNVAGISVSGYCTFGKVNSNLIIDMVQNTTTNFYSCIENAGCSYCEFNFNQFKSVLYGFSGISSTNTAGAIPKNTGCSFIGNIMNLTGGSDNTKVRGFLLTDVYHTVIANNIITTDGYAGLFDSCFNNNIHDNICYSKAVNILYFQDGCQENKIHDNTLDNQLATENDGTIFFTGVSTKNNYAIYNNLYAKSGGVTVLGSVVYASGAKDGTKVSNGAAQTNFYNPNNFGQTLVSDMGGHEIRIGDNDGQTIGVYGVASGSEESLNIDATSVTLNFGLTFALRLTGSATLDFPSTGATAVADLTITLTGAAVGDMVILGVPNASVTTTGQFTAWVSASNTIKVRFSPKATEDPASGTFTVAIIR